VTLTERRTTPCASVQPGTVALTVPAGGQGHTTLALGNGGTTSFHAAFTETDLALSPLAGSTTDVVANGVGPRLSAPSRTLDPPYTGGWRIGAAYPYYWPSARGVSCAETPGIIYTFDINRTLRYDTAADAWTEASPSSPLLDRDLSYSSPVCDGHTVHFFGGYYVTGSTNEHLTYNVITDTWAVAKPTPDVVGVLGVEVRERREVPAGHAVDQASHDVAGPRLCALRARCHRRPLSRSIGVVTPIHYTDCRLRLSRGTRAR